MAENAASDICRTRFLPGSCPIFHTNFFANCTKMDEYARIPRLCPTIFFVGPIFGRFLPDMSYVIEKLACKLRTIFARLDTIFARQFFKKFKKLFSPFFIFFTILPPLYFSFLTLFYLARKLPDFYRICPRIRTLDLSFLHRTLYR